MDKKEKGRYYLGQTPKTVCWVPDDIVVKLPDGTLSYNKEQYIQRRWHIENMRENIYGIGGHLFPFVPLVKATKRQIEEAFTLPDEDDEEEDMI